MEHRRSSTNARASQPKSGLRSEGDLGSSAAGGSPIVHKRASERAGSPPTQPQNGKGVPSGRSSPDARTLDKAYKDILLNARLTLLSDSRSSGVGDLARRIVRAAITIGRDDCLDESKAASAAAQGALLGAEELSYGAAESVRLVLTGSSGGVNGMLDGVLFDLPEPLELQNLE